MSLKLRRLLATCIDYCVIIYPISYFSEFLKKTISIVIQNKFICDMLIGIIFLVLLFSLFIRKDTLFGYESIGKKIMKLKIYDKEGSRIKDKRLLIDRVFRSCNLYFPLYPFMILFDNKSEGDKKMETRVK